MAEAEHFMRRLTIWKRYLFFHRVQFLMKKDAAAAAKKNIYIQKVLLNVPKGPV